MEKGSEMGVGEWCLRLSNILPQSNNIICKQTM